MTLQSRLALLITAIGADVKSLQTQINAINSGSTGPWVYVVAGSDVANSTVTPANVVSTGTGLAVGKYVLEGKMWWTAPASTTTTAEFNLVFPAQITLATKWQDKISTSTSGNTVTIKDKTPMSGQTPPTYMTVLDGIFVVSAAMASALSAQIRTEVAASAVTAKAGSYIRYRKIA